MGIIGIYKAHLYMYHSPPSLYRHHYELLLVMTGKEIKARYKRAVFGFLWIILNPLLQMLIIGTVFSFFIDIPNYFAFLFSGLLIWQFFSLTLSKTTPCYVFERDLLQKALFPRAVIPLSIIIANYFHLVISLLIFAPVLLLLQLTTLTNLFLFVPVLIWLLLFTIGLSLLTASLNVRYRDVTFFIQTILLLWFYVTPILYSLSSIPAAFQSLYRFNPLTGLFELTHLLLVGQGTFDLNLIILNLVETILIFFLGIYVFKKESPYFVDWM